MNKCTVAYLRKMTFDKHIKPYKFHASGIDISVDNWSHLCLIFVKWLIQNHFISVEKLPVANHAVRGKYFINTKPQHKIKEMDGYWHNVGPYHIDTKYNAGAHIRNILSALRHLGVASAQFQISFHAD